MIRSLRAPPQEYLHALAYHVQQLQRTGQKVVFITFNRPYGQLKEALRGQGAGDIFFLDSTGATIGHTAFLPDAMFVNGPSQLEGVMLRASLICKRMGPQAHVVLDSLNIVAQHNSLGATQEFTRHLVNAMRGGGVPVDFVVVDTSEGNRLCDALSMMVDSQESLATAA